MELHAFCIVDTVAEAKYVLTEFVGELQRCLHLGIPSASPFRVDRIVEKLRNCAFMLRSRTHPHDLPPAHDNVISSGRITTKIHEMNRKVGIQVSSLVETALYFCWPKILSSQKSPGLEENLRRFRSVWSCQAWGEVPLPVQSVGIPLS